ncbi:MAG: DUF2520 domain-containing protein [Myxococcales bacterium]|nr:DUF2520 domain-containing protein [Myxococcales bacterium]
MGSPLKVLVVGSGRLGGALALALTRNPATRCVRLVSHSAPDDEVAFFRDLNVSVVAWADLERRDVESCDLIVLAVADTSLQQGDLDPGLFNEVGRPVVHTSGALSSEVLERMGFSTPIGSWHPLQSFADPRTGADRFLGAFAALEGSPDAVSMARLLSDALSMQPVVVSTEGKSAYHAAAVMSSNLLVALTDAAVAAGELAGLTRERALQMLLPLQRGTLANLGSVGVDDALTGPVARGDTGTVAAHLEVLTPELAEIYSVLSRRAIAVAQRRGLLEEVADRLAELLDKPKT